MTPWKRTAALALCLVSVAAESGLAGRLPAVVTGRVSTGDSSVFLPGVKVSLVGADVAYGSTTDENGRFRFRDIAGGRYRLRAEKAGFITTEFGALEIGGHGTFVNVEEGREVDLDITLPRASSVAGSIATPDGGPAPDVLVTIRSTTGSVDRVWTDRRGRYRFHTLMPGEYIVSASPRSGLSRFLYPAVTLTSLEIDSILDTLRRGGPPDGQKPPTDPPRVVGMPTLYYPGTVEPNAAARLAVGVGTNLGGIDMTLVAGGTSRISGRIMGLEGPVPEGRRLLAVDNLTGTSYGGAVNSDGTFTFSNLPPGEYTIRVRILGSSSEDSTPTGTRPVVSWGRAAVQVLGDVQDVAVWLRAPMTIRGRVSPEGEAIASVWPPKWPQVELHRVPGDGSAPIVSAVSSDGTFSLVGVDPGVYSLDVRGVSASGNVWRLRAATASGRDLLAPFDVGLESSGISDVALVVSTRPTSLTGRLVASAQGESEYHVLAFPADANLWIAASKRLLSTRPDQNGQYAFSDIPEGEYQVAVLTSMPREWQSRAFLQSVAPLAARVRVEHGQVTTLDLRVGK